MSVKMQMQISRQGRAGPGTLHSHKLPERMMLHSLSPAASASSPQQVREAQQHHLHPGCLEGPSSRTFRCPRDDHLLGVTVVKAENPSRMPNCLIPVPERELCSAEQTGAGGWGQQGSHTFPPSPRLIPSSPRVRHSEGLKLRPRTRMQGAPETSRSRRWRRRPT